MNKKPQVEPIVIKKYANRRLYNTDTSSYVTLDDLCDMVKEGSEFIVYDAKSGEDLTRSVLTQIIFEQEGKEGSANLLPVNFLRSLIGFYDNSLKDFVPHYLESSMQSFQRNQEKLREMMGIGSLNSPLGGLGGFNQVAAQFEEISKQNMELFTKAFSMFSPFPEQKKK
jgi:polyhydroxyalkanoate synthesis repressor PhaR